VESPPQFCRQRTRTNAHSSSPLSF
jgi:hypothetical protein